MLHSERAEVLMGGGGGDLVKVTNDVPSIYLLFYLVSPMNSWEEGNEEALLSTTNPPQ